MFKSITNKIATMLIVALVASFAAISAVSYYTARDKVVELVSQTQDQILSDIKITTDTFFEDYLGAAKSLADNSKNQHDEEDILKALAFEKSHASAVISDIYFGREDDGHYFQSDNTKTTPEKDNYDPRTRGWYVQAKSENNAIYTEPYVDAINQTLVMTFAVPVNQNGKFAGVAGLDLKIDTLSKKNP